MSRFHLSVQDVRAVMCMFEFRGI